MIEFNFSIIRFISYHMNYFLNDAGVFIRAASVSIYKNIKNEEIVQVALNFALGMERILKGILFELNPIYVFTEPKFEHTLQTVYNDKILLKEDVLASKPNSDVITFKNSLLRALCISQTTINNRSILFKLENLRDILAHCDLGFIDFTDAKTLILRDFYPIIKSYSLELKIPQRHFFNGRHMSLATISSTLQADLKEKIKLLFEIHQEKWKMLRGTPGFIIDKEKETKNVLSHADKIATECPCCGNTGVIYLEPITENDIQSNILIVIGERIKMFKCRFCKLEFYEDKLFDLFGFTSLVNERNRKNFNSPDIEVDGISSDESQ